MKAAYVHKIGDITKDEFMTVKEDLPTPEPVKGQVLIKVHAAAINPVDWKMAEGMVPGAFKGGVMGSDVSGVVEKIGPETTTDLQVGDEVYGDIIGTKGAFGEYCVGAVEVLAKKPSNISMAEAASLPLCGTTALHGFSVGNFQKGQKVLIFGGTGGVGSLAVQIAKAKGASEVSSTGSQVEAIKKLGADVVINYKEQDLMEALKGKDFDMVFDTIGSYEHWNVAQASMKPNGTFVTIVGDNSGSILSDISKVLWRFLYGKIFGGQQYRLFMNSTAAPEIVERMADLSEMVAKGAVKPVLDDKQFNLTTKGVQELVKASKSHRAKGKLVLKVV